MVKLKDDLVLRQVAGEYLVMPIGRLSQICQMMHISSSAAFLWKVMQEGEFTEESLVERSLQEYTDVTKERLQKDVHNFLKLLDNNYMLDSGKPEPIMGFTKIQLTEKAMQQMRENEKNG